MLQKRFKAQQIPFPATELRDDVRKASLKLTRAYVAEVLQVRPGLAAAAAEVPSECMCLCCPLPGMLLLLPGLTRRQIACVCVSKYALCCVYLACSRCCWS